MHRLAQLEQMQTGMVVAQTQAMSTQSLPPMPRYSGEGDQAMDDGLDRWVDQFEERASRLLPEEVKASYSPTVSALKSRFKPVDIEELRGMEFHQLVQRLSLIHI